jgi:D-sedoheptulose 7-phosphate isomerase
VLTHLDRLVERHSILAECVDDIQRAYDLLADAFLNENKLLLCGNGGSAADSEHWAGELLKGFADPRSLPAHMREGLSDALANGLQWAFPVIPLTGFAAFSTAFSNDVSPAHVFAQLVLGLGQKDDLLGVLSTSGNSPNVCLAAQLARARGLRVLALTGKSGGALRELADVCICVPATHTPHVQELHLPVYHCLSLMLEESFAINYSDNSTGKVLNG